MAKIIAPSREETEKRVADQETPRRDPNHVLLALMTPTFSMILMTSMMRVALPAIRDHFQIDVDLVAWIVTAYTLPYVVFMPLFGRLGDDLGRRRLLLLGMSVFLIGTVIGLLAPNLAWLMLGRAVQGVGTAGFVPLAMAIISDLFPASRRGRALGTWNSAGPITGMVAPLLGGLLVDHLGWRTIFAPVLLVTAIALAVVARKVPALRGNRNVAALLRFDWGGVLLLSATMVSLLFYVTSEKITGVTSLQDWRLLGATGTFLLLFLWWERRQADPFVDLSLYSHPSFSLASVGASIRMFTMSGIGFVLPLYLADVHNLNAFQTGVMFMVHAGALLATMRLGGLLADKGSSRGPVILGMGVQAATMIYLALLPPHLSLAWFVAGVVVHGLGAGLSLAALHRAALGQVPSERMGIAAGLYSMSRFTGSSVGAALSGVLIHQGLNRGLLPLDAYQIVFKVLAVVAILGAILVGLRLEE